MSSIDLTSGGTYVFSNTGNSTTVSGGDSTTPIDYNTFAGVTTNFTGGGYQLTTMYSGNGSTNFFYGNAQNGGGGFFQFNLGSAKLIWQIDIYTYNNQYDITSFKWEGSLDGSTNWQTLHSHTTPALDGTYQKHSITISSPGTTPFQYYRLMDCITSDGSYFVIVLLELFERTPATSVTSPNLVLQSGIINEAITFNGAVSASGNNVRMGMTLNGMGGGGVLINALGAAAVQSSTIQLKKDISPLSDYISVDSILEMEGVQFNYKQNDILDAGFIAEEVADVNPLFAIYGQDWTRDEKGKRILNHKDSDDTVPININDLAILAAAVEKVKDLDTKIKILKKDKD